MQLDQSPKEVAALSLSAMKRLGLSYRDVAEITGVSTFSLRHFAAGAAVPQTVRVYLSLKNFADRAALVPDNILASLRGKGSREAKHALVHALKG